MTSARFRVVNIGDIKIARKERQRKALEGIDVLADSIRRLGLIHPPVVTDDLLLVSGERRLEACRSLGWDRIAVQYQDEVEPSTLYAIELEENIKRLDIPWQEQCSAVLQYHQIRGEAEGPGWRLEDTAIALGMTTSEVSNRMKVARELLEPDSGVAAIPLYSTALNTTRRRDERRQAAEVERVHAAMHPVLRTPTPEYVQVGDFLKWAPTYDGPPFNVLHCDFPYGIGSDKFGSDRFASKFVHGTYVDTEEHYYALLDCLLENLPRIMTETGHMIFWFSMRFYEPTLNALSGAFSVDPFPLIWLKSDNAGISPDMQRGPRRIYETAFFCTRGDRPIVRMVSNAIAAPTTADRHMSEKPLSVVSHFLRMLVDGTSTVLDPTAGSGNALKAAKALAAERIFGLDINPDFVAEANRNIRGLS